MPRTLSAALIAQLGRKHRLATVALLDVQTIDGTLYYWAEISGSFPVKLGAGPNANYSAWLKKAGPFRRSKDTATDAGDIAVQNLSGNSIQRDAALALKNHEFEGALAVVRFWEPLLGAVVDEYHGTLSDQQATEEEVTFRMLQLLDASQFDVNDRDFLEQCPWLYKGPQCGSAGAAATCDKKLSTCQDATHLAQERFAGIPSPPPQTNTFTPPVITGPLASVGLSNQPSVDDARKQHIR